MKLIVANVIVRSRFKPMRSYCEGCWVDEVVAATDGRMNFGVMDVEGFDSPDSANSFIRWSFFL